MKFMDMNKKLKDHVENVYVIQGCDLYLVKQAINNLKSFLIQDFEDFNFSKIEAEKLRVDEANSILSTLPVGNAYRLVVLNNPNIEVQKFINKFNFEDLGVVVVCLNADKITVGEEIDCNKLDKIDINRYVLYYLKKENHSIEERALDFLIDATNSDMAKIINEMNKLSAFANNEEVITMDMATNLIANSNEYAIYMLTNAIDNKDYTTYQRILNELGQSQSLGDLFSYLGKYFKRMQYIALNKNDEEIAKLLNIKPYAVKMSRQFVQRNGIKFYLNIYERYVNLDWQIKSGKISVNNALYLLVF